jgi:hypothetical protein
MGTWMWDGWRGKVEFLRGKNARGNWSRKNSAVETRMYAGDGESRQQGTWLLSRGRVGRVG